MTTDDLSQRDEYVARIVVSEECGRVGMPGKIARALYRTAIDQGSKPGDWRGTFDPVPQEKWAAVEVFDDDQWVSRSFPSGPKIT